MLSAKILSCLVVVSAIVVASYEAHAEVAEPDEGSKVLTLPSSAISQHDTTQSLRTADAAVAKANEERVALANNVGITRNSLRIAEKALRPRIRFIRSKVASRQFESPANSKIHRNLPDHILNNLDYYKDLAKQKDMGKVLRYEQATDYYNYQNWLRLESKRLKVGDVDKGKAAAGAYAGTVHAAM